MCLLVNNAVLSEPLQKSLLTQLNSGEYSWLTTAIKTLNTSNDKIEDLLNFSVLVKRTFTGEISLALPSLKKCQPEQLIRVLLIKAAQANLTTTEQVSLLKQYYRGGDESEKIALLKGLTYLDKDGAAKDTAINASRCNSVSEFSALALHNDYPANNFPELNFNQLVLKTLFMGLDISDISQLSKRLNHKLSNMVFSYLIEQALAERVPPSSAWLAIVPQQLTDEHSLLLNQYLQHFCNKDNKHQQMITALVKQYKLIIF